MQNYVNELTPPRRISTNANLPSMVGSLANRELENFIHGLEVAEDISASTANQALDAWLKICESTASSMPVPDAASGPNAEFLYTWNRDEHHLELEIFADGSAEFFYRNRTTGQLWEAEYDSSLGLTDIVKARLTLFF